MGGGGGREGGGGKLRNPEGRSGKPPSRGKKIPRVYIQS